MTELEPACASPLEWHPAYRSQTWLLDWLEGRGPFSHLTTIRLPLVQPLKYSMAIEPTEDDVFLRVMIMTRRRAWGRAPYVGDPFVYEWSVGIDELGRQIAGDSRIVYYP
jgi:hypothetical protein